MVYVGHTSYSLLVQAMQWPQLRMMRFQMSSTKELAAQLGLLRTRKLGKETNTSKGLQNLSHLLVAQHTFSST